MSFQQRRKKWRITTENSELHDKMAGLICLARQKAVGRERRSNRYHGLAVPVFPPQYKARPSPLPNTARASGAHLPNQNVLEQLMEEPLELPGGTLLSQVPKGRLLPPVQCNLNCGLTRFIA